MSKGKPCVPAEVSTQTGDCPAVCKGRLLCLPFLFLHHKNKCHCEYFKSPQRRRASPVFDPEAQTRREPSRRKIIFLCFNQSLRFVVFTSLDRKLSNGASKFRYSFSPFHRCSVSLISHPFSLLCFFRSYVLCLLSPILGLLFSITLLASRSLFLCLFFSQS